MPDLTGPRHQPQQPDGTPCRHCGIGEWRCNPVPYGDIDSPIPECCPDCDHAPDRSAGETTR